MNRLLKTMAILLTINIQSFDAKKLPRKKKEPSKEIISELLNDFDEIVESDE